MKKMILFVCSVLLVCPWLPAQPPPPDEAMARRAAMMERLADELQQPLPRPLKIQFRFEPQNPGDKPVWVIASTSRYGVSVNMEGAGHIIHVEIKGALRNVNDKILLTYESEFAMKAPESGGMITAQGSAYVTPGKEKTIANLGDRALVVLVSYEDEGK